MESNKKGALLIYARNGSSRLPNKALKEIGRYKLIELVINRVINLQNTLPIQIYLATSNLSENDNLVSFVEELGISVFRGDENDLVDRTIDFIKQMRYKCIARVNGDCPFVDIELIAEGFKYINQDYDFVTNLKNRTYPYGVAVEWFKSGFYIKMANDIYENEKEHVTKHLYRKISEINHYSIESSSNNSDISLTIDTQQDYERIKLIFEKYSKASQLKLSYKNIINDYTF